VNQPVIPQVNIRLQFHAIGAPEGPEGTVDYYFLIEKGVIVEAHRGRIEGSELTISSTYRDLVDFQAGELPAATAFMTGQFAVTGDKAKLLELMLVLQSGIYHRLTAELWARTTW